MSQFVRVSYYLLVSTVMSRKCYVVSDRFPAVNRKFKSAHNIDIATSALAGEAFAHGLNIACIGYRFEWEIFNLL